MCRTFSKIYGLAALRLGWLYGPAHVVDAINRIRGPFNVNPAAIAAGIAAIERRARMSRRARAHNETWLAWLTEEIRKLGLDGDAERREFRADPFPGDQGRTAEEADAFLDRARSHPAPGRGLSPAPCAAHDASAARRRTGWSSPRLREFMGGRREPTAPLFNRLALIGVGLIGSSIARAARAQGVRALDRRHRPNRARRAGASPSSGSPTKWSRPTRRRPTAPIWSSSAIPVGAKRRGRAGDRAASQAGRDRLRRRLGQGRGAARHGAAYSARRAFRSRPSGRRDRIFRARTPASPSCSSIAGAS